MNSEDPSSNLSNPLKNQKPRPRPDFSKLETLPETAEISIDKITSQISHEFGSGGLDDRQIRQLLAENSDIHEKVTINYEELDKLRNIEKRVMEMRDGLNSNGVEDSQRVANAYFDLIVGDLPEYIRISIVRGDHLQNIKRLIVAKENELNKNAMFAAEEAKRLAEEAKERKREENELEKEKLQWVGMVAWFFIDIFARTAAPAPVIPFLREKFFEIFDFLTENVPN